MAADKQRKLVDNEGDIAYISGRLKRKVRVIHKYGYYYMYKEQYKERGVLSYNFQKDRARDDDSVTQKGLTPDDFKF